MSTAPYECPHGFGRECRNPLCRTKYGSDGHTPASPHSVAVVAALSLAYSDAVREGSALREGSYLASQPLGKRVAVQIPEAQWQKLAAAICAITGGEVV